MSGEYIFMYVYIYMYIFLIRCPREGFAERAPTVPARFSDLLRIHALAASPGSHPAGLLSLCVHANVHVHAPLRSGSQRRNCAQRARCQ